MPLCRSFLQPSANWKVTQFYSNPSFSRLIIIHGSSMDRFCWSEFLKLCSLIFQTQTKIGKTSSKVWWFPAHPAHGRLNHHYINHDWEHQAGAIAEAMQDEATEGVTEAGCRFAKLRRAFQMDVWHDLWHCLGFNSIEIYLLFGWKFLWHRFWKIQTGSLCMPMLGLAI